MVFPGKESHSDHDNHLQQVGLFSIVQDPTTDSCNSSWEEHNKLNGL